MAGKRKPWISVTCGALQGSVLTSWRARAALLARIPNQSPRRASWLLGHVNEKHKHVHMLSFICFRAFRWELLCTYRVPGGVLGIWR